MELVTNVTTKKEAPGWYERFLTLLSDYGNVTIAARGAGISRLTAYRYRNTDPRFAEQWEAALELGVDGLEDEARRRAASSSDVLLIFMLKSLRPEKYRERVEQRTVMITPEQAASMTDAELDAELKRRGLV